MKPNGMYDKVKIRLTEDYDSETYDSRFQWTISGEPVGPVFKERFQAEEALESFFNQGLWAIVNKETSR